MFQSLIVGEAIKEESLGIASDPVLRSRARVMSSYYTLRVTVATLLWTGMEEITQLFLLHSLAVA